MAKPRQDVAAAPAIAPRYGLLAAAPLLDDGANWQGGVQWEAESCSPGSAGPADCAPLDREADKTSPGLTVSNPFLVWAVEACSALGFHGRDWQGRARRALDASQSFSIARELWTGDITQAQFPGDPAEQSPFLTDEHTVNLALEGGFSASAPIDAIAIVEGEASQCSKGRRLMIHVPTWVLTDIRNKSAALVRDGNTITTDIGSIIVADAGYDGSPPTGVDADPAQTWIYATPIVQIRLDQVEVLPNTLTDARDLAAMLNWSNNDVAVWAQRLALYQLDPCCRFGLPTTIPLVTPPS